MTSSDCYRWDVQQPHFRWTGNSVIIGWLLTLICIYYWLSDIMELVDECERVTELSVVTAALRSLPVFSFVSSWLVLINHVRTMSPVWSTLCRIQTGFYRKLFVVCTRGPTEPRRPGTLLLIGSSCWTLIRTTESRLSRCLWLIRWWIRPLGFCSAHVTQVLSGSVFPLLRCRLQPSSAVNPVRSVGPVLWCWRLHSVSSGQAGDFWVFKAFWDEVKCFIFYSDSNMDVNTCERLSCSTFILPHRQPSGRTDT